MSIFKKDKKESDKIVKEILNNSKEYDTFLAVFNQALHQGDTIFEALEKAKKSI